MTLKDRWHRLTNFEYWPFWLFYLPVFLIWPYLAWKGRSVVFFTNSNPFIPLGGSLEESKSLILSQLPKDYLPDWLELKYPYDLDLVNEWMNQQHLSWPVIAKPDVGERGDLISVLRSTDDLVKTSQTWGEKPFILQAYLTEPFEAGVMVLKDPSTKQFKVTSVVTKEFLKLTGNGHSDLEELIQKIPRARFQWDRLKSLGVNPKLILPKGESLILEPIGNHKRGTTFINSNDLLTAHVTRRAIEISNLIPGFYFGRFDLKAPSVESFMTGDGWKIMELNGAFSEPGHIYDPQNKLLDSWRDLLRHWISLAEISKINSEQGHPHSSLREFLVVWCAYLRRQK